jgi:transcriptional regulator of acetoin/glycerol metabolism
MTNISDGERLLGAWQRYTSGAVLSGSLQSIRPVTLHAWDRCRHLGVDPENLEPQFLTDEALELRRTANRELLEVARPYMEYLSMLMGSTPHVIALADSEAWILELLGDPESFGGRTTGIWVGASWAEGSIGNNGVGTALATESPVLVFGIEHFGRAYHPASCLGVPIRRNGEIIGVLDISVLNEDADPERLTMAQACVRSIETTLDRQADSSDDSARNNEFKLADRLLSLIIHDVKQPLSAMRATSQLGSRNASDENGRRYFEMLIRQIDRVTEALERAGTDPMREPFIVGSARRFVEDAVEDIRPVCAVAGVNLTFDSDSDGAICVQPTLFSRVLTNLAVNAVEAMPDGGCLAISVLSEPGATQIRFSDSGSGIPREIRSRVFDPLVSGRKDGKGLGLYTVHQAVTENFRGRVWFETSEGQGTTFFIELPQTVSAHDA